jgi:hypothetical protein
MLRRQPMDSYPGVLEGTAVPEVQADREPAGISATVEIHLRNDADYFLFRARLDSRRSRCDVIRFGSGWGGALRADTEREHERLAVPEWHGGAVYDDPHGAIVRRERVGKAMVWPYIGGAPNSLLAGWVDLYGRRGGLGLGYIGKSGQMVAFEAGTDGDGLSLNWRTFDLSGVTTYFGDHAVSYAGIYPLEAGRTYTSDWWIVAPHEGDWHRMADIYRQEYERAFSGEYLTAETVSPLARRADYILPCWLAHRRGGLRFERLPAAVAACVNALGVPPEHVLLWVIGTQKEGFDTTFPDFFPMHEPCGGEEAARRAFDELRRWGLGGTFIYTNPSYNHPLARLFVPGADTGIRANHGDFACFASPAWREMWLKELVPALLTVGTGGIMLDQWPLLFCPCRRRGHGHRTDSLAAQRGQVLGKRAWIRALRDAFAAQRPDWFFFTESGSDHVGGLADIWTFNATSTFYHGGRPTAEIARFTHPQYVMTSNQPVPTQLINGLPLIAADVRAEGDGAASNRALAAKPEVREYLRLRGELRSANPPGFPQGFRHTLGLAVASPDLHARAYRDARGITVLYYAEKDVQTQIHLDPGLLDHPEQQPEVIPVALAAGQSGHWSRTYRA